MPVKIEPRKSRGIRIIGDWSRTRLISDPPDAERRALKVEKNPVKLKHAKVTPPKDTREGIISPDDPLIKIKMKKTVLAAPDRIHTQELKKGRVYEIPASFAERYIKKGYAVKITKGEKK